MPIEKTITLYTFDELPSAKAKEAALTWYREGNIDSEWFESVFEGFREVCKAFNITLAQGRPIEFSGFASQGDGARFAGTWQARDDGKSFAAAIAEHAPQDVKLKRIGELLDRVQLGYEGQVFATIAPSRAPYVHRFCTRISVELQDNRNVSEDCEETVTDAMRDLMLWLYRQLEATWDDINSDENVAESIRANGYTFRANGKREDI